MIKVTSLLNLAERALGFSFGVRVPTEMKYGALKNHVEPPLTHDYLVFNPDHLGFETNNYLAANTRAIPI